MTNITASKLEQLEVTRSRARLAELTAHIEQVKEQERTRIAREIHDDLGGNLTAIKMALMMLTQRLPADQPQLRERAGYVDALVDRTIEAVHRISLDLRPSMLDFGLVAALEWQGREFEKQNGIACAFASSEKEIELGARPCDGAVPYFPGSADQYRQARQRQPGHGAPAAPRAQVLLTIADNGVRHRQADRLKPSSFGLRGMNERASALGGTMTLAQAPGGGTLVTIKIRLTRHRPR